MTELPNFLKNELLTGKVLKNGDWPNGAKCAVSFSFSVHAPGVSLMLNLGWKKFYQSEMMTLVGLNNVLELLGKYDIKGTFWVLGYLVEKYPEIFKHLHNLGHEIGNVGYLRQYKTPEEMVEETEKSDKIIKDIVGEKPLGIKLLAFNKDTLKAAVKCGFIYEGTFAGNELPFELIIDAQNKILSIPNHREMDSYMDVGHIPPDKMLWYPARHLTSPNILFNLWKAEFDGCYKKGLCITSLFHPHVDGKSSHALLLERFIQYIQGHPKVWIAPLKEVALWAKTKFKV